MKALFLEEINGPIRLVNTETPQVSEGQVLVELRAAALNHRDVWIRKGQYAHLRFPFIPGSDGAGFMGNEPVVINPGIQWGENPMFQAQDFHILGMPTNGTFAQKVLVPADQIYPMPDHLSFEEAAAIPLSGVTAFRAVMTRGKVKYTDRVLITGIGGGVALWAMQFALATGAEVWVTSGSEEKIEKAKAMGATGGFSYRDPDWIDGARNTIAFDLVIDGAGGAGLGQIMKICSPGGRMVCYGGTTGSIPKLSPQLLFWKQLQLIGSTMGSPQDFKEMISFICDHRIVPVVDRVYPLEQGEEAYTRMEHGNQFGKIVLQIPE
ncbi:MAG: zinc-binding dehydrogenase [Saprospiraceae bacterium]|nr:zinc-binding dehydrogenase [Saprospiraceae bacterium]